MNYKFSKHALEQISRRGISEELIFSVLSKPDQIINIDDKKIFQSLIIAESDEKYLIRVFVNMYPFYQAGLDKILVEL